MTAEGAKSSPGTVDEPRAGPTRAERDRALAVVGRHLRDRLEPLGFVADGAHLVRRSRGVSEVVELQHSIYGTRITANLGLDLDWLRPLIRWIPRPRIGPHAHDCVRWIRVGLVEESQGDRWWSYDPEDEPSLESAASTLAERVAGPGLGWVERERTSDAFLAHARRALERSRSRAQPEGGYLELRLLAAVHAWRGEVDEAVQTCSLAHRRWPEERARLVMARKIYRRRHPRAPARLAPVPDLQAELERITEPTTGARVLRRAGAQIEARTPSSKSGPGSE